ncbi:helix-turn-helix domain-containing protein [Terasakiella pusilla]|uniref:helix-turn-helix domain-containing protein n=1 Tax=Terasakiella pusilla TaxID=64973 RepID=UPI003AA94E2C
MKNVKQLSIDLSVLEDEASAFEDSYEHKTKYKIPKEQGSLNGLFLETSHDMFFYHGDYQFNKELVGQEYFFGNVDLSFSEETFMANVMTGGMVRFEEQIESEKMTYNFGQDLTYFGKMKGQVQDIFFQPSKSMTNSVLTVPISSLMLLIGEETTDKLLLFLGLGETGLASIKQIPMRITQILKSAVNPHLTGSMKQLYCQAKALEYLCELVELMEKSETNPCGAGDGAVIISDMHDKLIDHVGRLPNLAELAEEYNVPARTLNARFQKQYGLPISQYITKIRMEKAHNIIRNHSVPLKVVADKLGYSHVNHFITAFKREFGYPPGRLRKQASGR